MSLYTARLPAQSLASGSAASHCECTCWHYPHQPGGGGLGHKQCAERRLPAVNEEHPACSWQEAHTLKTLAKRASSGQVLACVIAMFTDYSLRKVGSFPRRRLLCWPFLFSTTRKEGLCPSSVLAVSFFYLHGLNASIQNN